MKEDYIMKAIVLKEAGVLAIEEFQSKPFDAGSEVLIKVNTVAICGTDLSMWKFGSHQKDLIMGHEFSGTVINPGCRSDLKVGDKVTAITISPCMECDYCKNGQTNLCVNNLINSPGSSAPGALRDEIAIRGDLVIKVPDSVSFKEAALAEPLSVAYHSVKRADIKEGDTVLVTGAGAIGAFCAELSLYSKAKKVVIVDINQQRLNAVGKCHSEFVTLNSTDEGFMESLKMHSGAGFDSFIECTGITDLINQYLHLVKKSKTIVMTGTSLKAEKPLQLIFVTLGDYVVKGTYAYTVEDFKDVVDIIINRRINLTPYIGKGYTVGECNQAFIDLKDPENKDFKKYIVFE